MWRFNRCRSSSAETIPGVTDDAERAQMPEALGRWREKGAYAKGSRMAKGAVKRVRDSRFRSRLFWLVRLKVGPPPIVRFQKNAESSDG